MFPIGRLSSSIVPISRVIAPQTGNMGANKLRQIAGSAPPKIQEITKVLATNYSTFPQSNLSQTPTLNKHKLTPLTSPSQSPSAIPKKLGIDPNAPLKPVDEAVYSKYSAEEIELGDHFNDVKDQAAQFLTMSRGRFESEIKKSAPESSPSSLILIPSGRPKKVLKETQRTFIQDARKVIDAFSLAAPNQPAAESNAKKELFEFIKKYGGRADRFQDKSLPELKAMMETELRMITDLKSADPKSEYWKQQASFWGQKIREETFGKGLSLAAIAAIAGTIFGWAQTQTPEAKKKATLDSAKSEIDDYKTAVNSRKEAEQNLAAQKRAIDSLKDSSQLMENRDMMLAHLASIMDEEFPSRLEPDDAKAVSEAFLSQEAVYRSYSSLIYEHKELREELIQRLEQSPQLKEKLIEKRALELLKEKNQSPYGLFQSETPAFIEAKEKVRETLQVTLEDIPKRNPPEIRTEQNFKDVLGVDQTMSKKGKERYDNLAASSKESRPLEPIKTVISHLEANCSKLKGLADNNDERKALIETIDNQVRELQQAGRGEYSLKAEAEKKLETVLEERISLERLQRSNTFSQTIMPRLTKERDNMLTVLRGNPKNIEAYKLEKEQIKASMLKKESDAQKSFTTRFFKGVKNEDVPEEKRNELIELMASHQAAKKIYIGIEAEKYVLSSQSANQELVGHKENLATLIEALKFEKKVLDGPPII